MNKDDAAVAGVASVIGLTIVTAWSSCSSAMSLFLVLSL